MCLGGDHAKLLQILLEQFIVDQQGKIIACELHAPFAFLRYLVEELYTLGSESHGSSQLRLGAQKKLLTDSVEQFFALTCFEQRGRLADLPIGWSTLGYP